MLTSGQYADYPGIVPYEKGEKVFERELAPEERCVRGTLVIGLTPADIKKLDTFEGNVSTSLDIYASRGR